MGNKATDKANPEESPTNETIYCRALAETLHEITLPVTVGFFAPWGRNKKMLINNIENHMSEKSNQSNNGTEDARPVFIFLFILHIIFACPGLTPGKPKSIRYIFINFDAWEYVGCDCTWAGLVTTLLDETEGKNKISFSAFRVFGAEFPKETGKKKKWVLKGWTKVFLSCLACLLLGLSLIIVLMREKMGGHLWENMAYTVTSLFGLFSLPFICCMKNLLFTLKKELEKEMNRKNLSDQLGFMHLVKQEVKTITDFLRFMAFEENQEIRVVLKIINLDLCTPDKVVAVLDAMKILLSDKDAPFITILAADPKILVDSIQRSSNTWSNGYLYLDQIVSLPFSLPPMSFKAKKQLLKETVKKEVKPLPDKGTQYGKIDSLSRESILCDFKKIFEEEFDDYIPGNSVQMIRVVNSVLTILYMLKLGFIPKLGGLTVEEDSKVIREVTDWVILAHFWPCRLSWIFQCEEDKRQQEELKKLKKLEEGNSESREGNQQCEVPARDEKTLLDFYEDNALELDKIKNNIRELLELDGDPDLFRVFLNKSHFTVEQAKYFSDLLINLDFSLKRRFELLRGLNRMTDESSSAEKNSGG
ncbi:NTPase KAP family P-loop domain-containing protein 1-like [Rhineura floridana]|uniref:NTPase KAP family P-loop domain-containing protein 1-like n=1 Tax=Rhineura floridana TaxID=261503 RepID=UPI002AC80706|nr:NTPase KAP family P-loop domain-containing protein 1-like [Rhineura floridana]